MGAFDYDDEFTVLPLEAGPRRRERNARVHVPGATHAHRRCEREGRLGHLGQAAETDNPEVHRE
eukprot:12330819-Prorocentrum_lima.AAC.1